VERDWSDGTMDVVIGCRDCGTDIPFTKSGKTPRVCRGCQRKREEREKAEGGNE